MKLNLSIATADVPNMRSPIIGEDVQVYFAAENCLHLGTVRATGTTTGEYTSAGGLGIPVGGRECFVRVNSSNCRGNASSAMAVTFNVILDDDDEDTAVATFHLPTWAPSGSKNVWPYGMSADLVPAGVGNSAKKIKTIVGLASVANMTAGNGFELFTSPDSASFTFIDCCRGKGGALNLPGIIEIACGRNPSAYTKLGRGESNPLKIEFVNRGALEQLAIYNGFQGTIRFDIVKDDAYLSERRLFTGFFVRSNGEMPDTGEAMNTAEGPYTSFAIGYPRVA
jgi:hypothetical protein